MTEIKTRQPTDGLVRRRKSFDDNFMQNRVESILTENSYTSIQFIPIERLIAFKNQRRSFFDEEKLKTLADTIKEHGIRQPLTVIQSEEDVTKFEIVSGERRFMAAKMIGLDKVPCIVIHNRNAAEEIAIIENVQRADLHPIELGRAYSGLLENNIVSSKSDLAAKIGVPRTQVSEYITFSKFPESIANSLVSNGISSRRILRKIARCTDITDMAKVISTALGETIKERKKVILRFSLSGDNVEVTPLDYLHLSQNSLEILKNTLENVLQEIIDKLPKL